MLRHCNFCELRCNADRTKGESAPCGLTTSTFSYKRYVSLHEHSPEGPSLRLFLSGCNFRCRFCDEAPACFDPIRGQDVDAHTEGSKLVSAASSAHAKTISILGGEPTLHVHTLLDLAAATSSPLPLVINSNMYMTPEVLDLLGGVVAHYLADFKFGSDRCAERLAGITPYVNFVQRNLLIASRTTGLTIRHLLMPGHMDCCFRPVVDWVAAELPNAEFRLFTGYVPCWRAGSDPDLGRLNSLGEVAAATEYLRQSRLSNATLASEAEGLRVPVSLALSRRTDVRNECRETNRPAPERAPADLSVTVGADGRLYCHDATPELYSVLAGLAQEEPLRQMCTNRRASRRPAP